MYIIERMPHDAKNKLKIALKKLNYQLLTFPNPGNTANIFTIKNASLIAVLTATGQ